MDKIINIALNIDSKYVVPCCTMLCSIFENNKNKKFCIHIISEDLNDCVISDIEELVESKYNQELFFYTIDSKSLNNFPQYKNSHISQAANCRLFIADILPSEVTKVLYLDCDLIVDSSLESLWETDMSDHPVAVVEDMWSGKDDNYVRLNYKKEYGYFNSGVMLINLAWWREKCISKVCIEYMREHDNLKFVDQDILNGLLHDRRELLPLRWNVQDGFLRRKPKIRKLNIESLKSEIKNPAIIHFTGSRKPWDYDCLNPYRERYFHYLDMTKWKGTRPIMPIKFKLKLLLDNVLYFFYLKPHKYIKV